MQKQTIVSGTIVVPYRHQRTELHQKIGEFHDWLKRPKDHSEIRRDKRQSAPQSLLPMVF